MGVLLKHRSRLCSDHKPPTLVPGERPDLSFTFIYLLVFVLGPT